MLSRSKFTANLHRSIDQDAASRRLDNSSVPQYLFQVLVALSKIVGEASMSVRTLSLVAAFVSAVSAPALAHHSFAKFDSTKSITVSGTVKKFEWSNPHSWIHLVVQDASGKQMEWAIEMGSPGQQVKRGWKSDSLRTGDEISVTFHPLKDGSHGGQFVSAVLASELPLINPGATGVVVTLAPPTILETPDVSFTLPYSEISAPRVLMIGLVLALLAGVFRLRLRTSR